MLDFGFYNMDCMDGMKQFPDKYFELAIVDPPYGLKESGCQSGGENNYLGRRAFKRSAVDIWDKKPSEEYFEELFRVSKNQIIWGGNYFELPPSRCVVVWDKVQPWENFSQVEIAWTSFKLNARLFKYDNRTGEKIHPTQKPVALYTWLLNNYANKGDKVLDTHVGSASSLIACHKLGFDYVGFELDPDYYKAATERLEAVKSQISLFDEPTQTEEYEREERNKQKHDRYAQMRIEG